MEYEIRISETFLEEIEEIFEYIEEKLKAKESAYRLRGKIIKKINNLKYSPRLYAKIGKKDRSLNEYRKIIIDNYVILYTIIEDDNVILISHIYYGKRNYLDGGII